MARVAHIDSLVLYLSFGQNQNTDNCRNPFSTGNAKTDRGKKEKNQGKSAFPQMYTRCLRNPMQKQTLVYDQTEKWIDRQNFKEPIECLSDFESIVWALNLACFKFFIVNHVLSQHDESVRDTTLLLSVFKRSIYFFLSFPIPMTLKKRNQ